MPISVRDKKRGGTLAAPCGKCPACRLRRIQSWVFRLRQEEKIHETALFVTLTYSPENVPLTSNRFMDLRPNDLTLFWKRLRRYTGCKTIKYYAVGEYGGKTRRPHYHAIIYDVDYNDIVKAWTLGHIHVGTVTDDSIAYTAKYMYKPKTVPAHANDDRTPEFSRMSKNMGLNYLSQSIRNYYETTQNSFITLPGGAIQALPRYYRDRLFTPEERDHINAKAEPSNRYRLELAIREAGGADNYFRNHHAMVVSELRKFNNEKNKRDGI